ncbi:MAG: alpha amylase C-terminal domain-containing protein, partial [Parachlamydiaceae bacterium]
STFEWIDFSDVKNNAIAYMRRSRSEQLLCVHNFSPNYVKNYHLHVPNARGLVELFNSDAEAYGGSGKTNAFVDVNGQQATFQLAPLSTMIFQVYYS